MPAILQVNSRDLHSEQAIRRHVTTRELPHRPVTLPAHLPSTAIEACSNGSKQSRANAATFTKMNTLQENEHARSSRAGMQALLDAPNKTERRQSAVSTVSHYALLDSCS